MKLAQFKLSKIYSRDVDDSKLEQYQAGMAAKNRLRYRSCTQLYKFDDNEQAPAEDKP